jgi:hemerythrin-like domain-containing protein
VKFYQAHIKGEEAELFPMAARLLTEVDLGPVGAAMRIRRGDASPGEPRA